MNLGIALATLGVRESGTARLEEAVELIDFNGGRTRARTVDPLIKSLMVVYFSAFPAFPKKP
jgi:hypothetical protein